jgi:CreA protein
MWISKPILACARRPGARFNTASRARLAVVGAVTAALLSAIMSARAERIGSVNYRFKWIGPSDKIVVEAFDDPEVQGITCYLSRAETGGIKGAVGLAENPSEASIDCRQIGPIDSTKLDQLKQGREVFSARSSAIFKTTQVVRFYDKKRSVLIYLIYSDRIIEGSPQNSVSVVAIGR